MKPQEPHTALALEGIERRFGRTAALCDVSLTLNEGEIACLVGRSGCGKSSLLRLIAGVDRPDKGRILLGGEEIVSANRFIEPEDRNIGFMFQDYALFPHLTVEENIGFGLKALPRAEARSRVADVIERIGIGALAARYPHTLSGGEQQRVALARALAPNPVILLMDEPFSNLDRGLRERLREETLGHLRHLGTTAIMVTHDPEEALSVADTVVLMKDGRIVQAGTGYDIYDRPSSLHAAQFLSIGSCMSGRNRNGLVETPLGPIAAPKDAAEGSEVTVFVRPQALSLSADGTGVPARLLERAFMGEREQMKIAIEGIPEPVRIYTDQRLKHMPGDLLMVQVKAEALLCFA